MYSLLILLGGFMADPASGTKTGLHQNSSLPHARSANAPQLKNGPVNKTEILARAAAITIPFVKNVGQFDPEVMYAADLFAGGFS